MEPALTILAVIGFAAALWRVARALFAAIFSGTDRYLARGAAQARAQRGDLTGMAEARERAAVAGRARWIALSRALLWLAVLVLPALSPWPRSVYAAYSVLWLFLRGWEERRRGSLPREGPPEP